MLNSYQGYKYILCVIDEVKLFNCFNYTSVKVNGNGSL